MIKKYIIMDDEGYYWCESKGTFTDKYGNTKKKMLYWANGEHDLYEGEIYKRMKKMFFVQAVLLLVSMKLSGIKADIKQMEKKKEARG